MPSAGWHDPIWSHLYGPSAQTMTPAPIPDSQEAPVVDYLDQLQAAAAAGQTLNLSDLPGFQTNLQSPSHG